MKTLLKTLFFVYCTSFLDTVTSLIHRLNNTTSGYLQAEFVMTLVIPPLVGEDGLEYIFLFVSNGSSASWCLKANFATDKVTPVVVSTHGFVLPLEMFIGETIAKSPKLQERLSLSMMQYDDNNMRPCGA